MLSSVLRSKAAIQINIQIVRAFVAMRQSFTQVGGIMDIQSEMKELKAYLDDVFTDYNDINEDTRMQIELIHQTLAGLQSDKKLFQNPERKSDLIPKNNRSVFFGKY